MNQIPSGIATSGRLATQGRHAGVVSQAAGQESAADRKGEDESDDPFDVGVKYVGGDEADKGAAEDAACRNQQIELGEVPRVGAEADDFAVAAHAEAEEHQEADAKLGGERQVGPTEHFVKCVVGDDAEGSQRSERAEKLAVIPAGMVEANDEREQVDRKRRDEQERHRGDFGAGVVRRGEQHHRGERGERDPGGAIEPEASADLG